MEKTTEQLVATSAEAALFRQATDIAGLCKAIVVKSAVGIQGRKYVKVEGWMAIAVAHGCIATVKSVTEIPNGILAIAEVRRQNDGAVLTTAEGFVGKDEPTWYGGEVTRWNKFKNVEETATLPKRAEYAIRAMAQTRAVSRACRTAFAHVVVLMDAGLSTTPAEEVPMGGFDDEPKNVTPPKSPAENMRRQADEASAANPDLEEKPVNREAFEGGKWKAVAIHFGTNYKGKTLGELTPGQLKGWLNWQPKEYKGAIADDDKMLRLALDVAKIESETSS